MTDIVSLAQSILEMLKKRQHEHAEVYVSSLDNEKVNLRKGLVTESKRAVSIGYSVRIIRDGRIGFASATDTTSEAVESAIAKAENVLEYSDPDPQVVLPDYREQQTKASLDNYDEAIVSLAGNAKVQLAREIEEQAYATDSRIMNTEEVGVSTGVAASCLCSTRIPVICKSSTYIGGFADIVAEEGTAREAGSYYRYVARLEDFSTVTIGREAAERAARLLNARSYPTQRTDLVLDPTVAVQFLSVLSSLFDAEQVMKGKSLLRGKVGQQVASSLVSIIDDACLPGGLGSAYYDDEGVPTQKTVLLEDGMLRSYLYDTRTAGREGRKSTGNAYRPSYKSQPVISPSNLYLKPGQESKESCLSHIDRGLYIFEIMGLHTANPVSGEFSLGAQGIVIENGVFQEAVKGIMIAGTLPDFLSHISFVGNDLQFFPMHGNLGSPTLCVADIMVSGENR